MRKELTAEDLAAFAPSEKVGIVGTLGPGGEPHASLLTTIMGQGPEKITIGEFSRGESKRNMRARPKVGFLVMGLDRRVWRGAALWRRLSREGAEYEAYNRQPMFRYNTYFGINTVHYLDLVGIEGPSPLPLGAIVGASLATMAKAPFARREGEAVMPPPALSILDRLASLSFLCHVDREGFPRIVPIVQARSSGPSRIVFSPGPWRRELLALGEGSRVAVLTMNLAMESFVTKGSIARARGGLLGVNLDTLYVSAPPCHGQAYPRRPLEAFVSP